MLTPEILRKPRSILPSDISSPISCLTGSVAIANPIPSPDGSSAVLIPASSRACGRGSGRHYRLSPSPIPPSRTSIFSWDRVLLIHPIRCFVRLEEFRRKLLFVSNDCRRSRATLRAPRAVNTRARPKVGFAGKRHGWRCGWTGVAGVSDDSF